MKKKTILPMNLQFFAEPDGSTDAGSAQSADTGSAAASSAASAAGNGADTAKYTDEQVNEIINRKFAKWKSDQEAQRSEAEKLAQMDDDQKTNYELDKAKSQAAELQDKLARYDMEKTARGLFETANIAVTDDDIGLVTTSDAETTKANVDRLIDFSKRIRAAAEKEFLQGNPVHRSGDRVGATTGSLGAQLAKQQNAAAQRPNHYFDD